MSNQLVSLSEYLKKFSSINSKFIDEFFSLYDEHTDNKDFVINFDVSAKWLNISKELLKKTLIESYSKNIDYKISLSKITSASDGRQSDTFYLTPDCFKKLCILINSSKSKKIHSYYIQLEKHIKQYKDNMKNIKMKDLFTPIFIISAICIFIVGIICLQLLDKLFYGSPNLTAIRLFGITIIINIIILVFIIMSFSKVKFTVGKSGPQGNKGSRGYSGDDGGVNLCNPRFQTAQEKKAFERSDNYLDMKPPLIERD